MNPSAKNCAKLQLRPFAGASWFRAINRVFSSKPLNWTHTRKQQSRFNPGPDGDPSFATLHLCESRTIAMQEVKAEIVLPDGTILSDKNHSWLFITVDVHLQQVAI